MSELKPCPFCGNTDLFYDYDNTGGYIICARKNGCGTMGTAVHFTKDKTDEEVKQEVYRKWNTRTPTTIDADSAYKES